jgi:hypothetical protein
MGSAQYKQKEDPRGVFFTKIVRDELFPLLLQIIPQLS